MKTAKIEVLRIRIILDVSHFIFKVSSYITTIIIRMQIDATYRNLTEHN